MDCFTTCKGVCQYLSLLPVLPDKKALLLSVVPESTDRQCLPGERKAHQNTDFRTRPDFPAPREPSRRPAPRPAPCRSAGTPAWWTTSVLADLPQKIRTHTTASLPPAPLPPGRWRRCRFRARTPAKAVFRTINLDLRCVGHDQHIGLLVPQRSQLIQRMAVEGQSVQLIEQLILRPEAAGKPGRQQDEQLLPAHRSFRAHQTFSAVMGISRMRTPQAFSSALAMAGQGVSITTSPMLLAPNGPCSS